MPRGQGENTRGIPLFAKNFKYSMESDLVLKRLYAAAPNRDAKAKIDTFRKSGAV
jgi:hypothetical protein